MDKWCRLWIFRQIKSFFFLVRYELVPAQHLGVSHLQKISVVEEHKASAFFLFFSRGKKLVVCSGRSSSGRLSLLELQQCFEKDEVTSTWVNKIFFFFCLSRSVCRKSKAIWVSLVYLTEAWKKREILKRNGFDAQIEDITPRSIP